MRRNHNRRRHGKIRSADALLRKLQSRRIGLLDGRRYQERPDKCMQDKRMQRVQQEFQPLVFSLNKPDLDLL